MKSNKWWNADEGMVNERVIAYAQEVERVNADHYDRFRKLDFLYDPNGANRDEGGIRPQVQDNLIQSTVDTVYSIVAATEIGARFVVKDAEWDEMRRAQHLEWYSENITRALGTEELANDAFRDGALKGTGLVKVYTTPWGDIEAERVAIDDIIVDSAESSADKPKQMHQRCMVDREELIAMFPEHEHAISHSQEGDSWAHWAGFRPIEGDDIVVIESWRLPVGKKGKPGYKSGRRCMTIDGLDLIDEEWDETRFPFAVFRWSKRDRSFFGISMAEGLIGHQKTVTKLGWQIDRQLDQMAMPTTYVRLSDANLAVKRTNHLGTIAVYNGDIPQTVIPKAVSPETYNREETVMRRAYELSGVSRMNANSTKPAGLESGAALRAYADITTQRFAQQEKAIERFKLDITWLVLREAKKLGAGAPKMLRKTRWGTRVLDWAAVDMGDVKYQMKAASDLGKTPAGKRQLAMEWAQAGVVSKDEARALIEYPDTEGSISMYTAAYRDIQRTVQDLLDGEHMLPEAFQNLKMGIWMIQQESLKAKSDGAPEEILEGMREWLVQAAYIMNPPAPPAIGGAPEPQQLPPLDPGAAPGPEVTGAGVAPAAML